MAEELAEMPRIGILDCQVCVPKTWTEGRILQFAEQMNPSGTTAGWSIRRKGSRFLAGAKERVQCQDHTDNVHIMLDA